MVNFREIYKIPGAPDRFTHMIHPYPAKLLVNIPCFFLDAFLHDYPNARVYDPFCGSGTVMLEANLRNHKTYGAEVCPLSRLICRVKSTPLDPDKLRKCYGRIISRLGTKPSGEYPNITNRSLWYSERISRELLMVLEAIEGVRDAAMFDFFRVCFSVCARKVSYADPRLMVPVRLKPDKYPVSHWYHKKAIQKLQHLEKIKVINIFDHICKDNIRRMEELFRLHPELPFGKLTYCATGQKKEKDRDAASSIRSNTIDLVVTSPPYVGAQKYIRSVSLSMGWLRMCEERRLKDYENDSIGREHYPRQEYSSFQTTGLSDADTLLYSIYERNPLRAHIAAEYLREMRAVFIETHRVMKKGSKFVLVTGDNQVCGSPFTTTRYLREIAKQTGFSIDAKMRDTIKSRGLMTKRNRTSSVIPVEELTVLRK
jgi:DNA modification methylase